MISALELIFVWGWWSYSTYLLSKNTWKLLMNVHSIFFIRNYNWTILLISIPWLLSCPLTVLFFSVWQHFALRILVSDAFFILYFVVVWNVVKAKFCCCLLAIKTFLVINILRFFNFLISLVLKINQITIVVLNFKLLNLIHKLTFHVYFQISQVFYNSF